MCWLKAKPCAASSASPGARLVSLRCPQHVRERQPHFGPQGVLGFHRLQAVERPFRDGQRFSVAAEGHQGCGEGARATWFLTATPAPATAAGLTVSIGGVPVPEMGGNGRNWSYDAARNAVVFEAASLPAPGQSVSFAYNVACMP